MAGMNESIVTIGSRRPTVEEGVAIILRSKTLNFRRMQLADWQERFGETFTDAVKAGVKAAWGKR